jgi:ATP-dependent exoDNAse (exonuclease V) beta subunit
VTAGRSSWWAIRCSRSTASPGRSRLFLDARHAGIAAVALEPLTLSANFRSQPAIVRWVNDAFRRILPSEDDIPAGAVGYSESVAMPGADGPAVEVHPFFDNDRDGEAAQVVALVKNARAADPDGTVGILVRSRGRLEQIVRALRASGLRFRAVEIEPLAQRTVVQDLVAITYALTHLGDRTAWLSILRAPWCGLKLADLLALGPSGTVWEAIGEPERLAALSDDGRARVARVREILTPHVDGRMRSALRDSVESAWVALGGPGCVEDATGIEDAGVYLDFLEANEDAGAIADRAAFERRLRKLYAVPDLEADERLQVMTMHKAKGLEFDTVILPGLGGGTEPENVKLFTWTNAGANPRSPRASLLVAPMNATGSDDEESASTSGARSRPRRARDRRLLYVATTRARTRLHICGDAESEEEGEIAAQGLAPRAAVAGRQGATCRRHAAAARRARRRAPRSPAARGCRSPNVPAAAVAGTRRRESARRRRSSFLGSARRARRIGTVAHGWLQRIAEEGLDAWRRTAGAKG